MKVKKTVAALCLAAIMATSVGASAWVPWEVDYPKEEIGTWQPSHSDVIINSKFTAKSLNGRSGAYVSDYNNNYYKMVHTDGRLQASAQLWRSLESKKGNSPMCKFWSWER